MIVGIVDAGIGNIGSLRGALYNEGWDSELCDSAENLLLYDRLILPGVGSFSAGMDALERMHLDEALKEYVQSGRPTLGICLGMHLLADQGTEGGLRRGIGVIPGEVTKLEAPINCRLPHVGWNSMSIIRPHPLLEGVKPDVDFYFVHNFAFTVADPTSKIGITTHGIDFCSFAARENVAAVQFHPEKSQRNGLKIIDNFCMWDGDA